MSAPTSDVEMQYQRQDQMVPEQQSPSTANNETAEAEPKKRTFLGMRGGGIILDLCACFICCEACEACCNCLDDCCCC